METSESPLPRILLAVVPAALVFLFFVSVLFVPVVQSASEELRSPSDVMVLLDDNAPSMPYAAWVEAQRRRASSHVFENAICAICLDTVEKREWVRDLPCPHVFHTGCLDGWVSRGHYYCPLCHRLVLQLLRDDAHAV
ncbi:ring finger domain protein [Diplodia corticola]|uniref:Ring finger domain protein n=1 Tax=Diplodia corticola TaxID=236234 RepID=A0A1J9QQR2_9PEZI|nr:ring finger domain protein [Diplodia corticola]OJD30785.1 ring finger domain protein [Diplodia corticola]